MKTRFMIMTFALIFVFFLLPSATAHAAQAISVTIDGQAVKFTDQTPVVVDGRTLVPVRGVFEAMGFAVDWNGDTRQATLTRANDVVVIRLGSSTFTTNGTNHTLDVPAQSINGRTMLPLRAVLESVGYYLDWNSATSTVIVSSTPIQAPVQTPAPIPQTQTAPVARGNTVGNIVNNGVRVQSGDTIYYISSTGARFSSISVKDADIPFGEWGMRDEIIGGSPYSVNVLGDWIYFAKALTPRLSPIFRVKTDGTGQEMLNEDICNYVNVVGDWIYYRNDSDGGKIYRMKTDGTGRQKLNDDSCKYIAVASDWIYYTNKDDGYSIYRIRTDGTGRQKLNDDNSEYINPVGDWIYYSNLNDGFKLYRIRADGTGKEKLNDDLCAYINVSGDWVYYANCEESSPFDNYSYIYRGKKLYRIKTDGTQRQLLADDFIGDYISIVGHWVCFGDERIRTDGTDKQRSWQ